VTDLAGEIFTISDNASFDPPAIVGMYFRPDGKTISIMWSQDDFGNTMATPIPFRFKIKYRDLRVAGLIGPLIQKKESAYTYRTGNTTAHIVDKSKD
jgi:hypothetical protein